MLVAALGSLLLAPGHIRNVVGCAAVGLTLWITCFAILCEISSAIGGRIKSS
jgi:hypothetical protein